MGSMNIFISIVFTVFSLHLLCDATQVTYDGTALKLNGERRIIISGAIHYPRSTPQMWPDLVKKAKEGGLNAIETYVFWNAHEPSYREYDFTGNLDLVKFIRTIQEAGLYAILRIGPYVCAEWNYGGLPVWLKQIPNMTFRTKNDAFMNEMKNFTTLIVDMMKEERLFANQEGPIILTQIENEYGDIKKPYGDDGKSYINWCANFAESLDIGIPWIMCKEDDAPKSMIATCNGFYCDQYHPVNNNPKFWTENWTGWFKKWGGKNPHRTAEDVAFSVARFFQLGGTLQNYYMYHGGTNFGRTSGGPYITTSYDYDAPLDEYGKLNQPKYGHLKELHKQLRSMEKFLTYGKANTTDYGDMLSSTVYTYNGKRVCFFGNANYKEDKEMDFEGRTYNIPAWSVSILPDCKDEVYNTAQVYTETSIVVKKLPDEAEEEQHHKFNWKWRRENFEQLKNNETLKGVTYADQLMDQLLVTNDTSDYLWYMTRIHVDENDPIWGPETTLHVEGKSHVLHAFVNGRHIGSRWATNDKFEEIIRLRHGVNSIVLLSVTVGLTNYGSFYDQEPNGITGNVKFIAPNGMEKDLSSNKWIYRVGLHGMKEKLWADRKLKWFSNIPSNKMFTWYKTTFKAPKGREPVVLDLQGMGKGVAWVNGHDIGRYWPSFLADKDGCSETCDYRGEYKGETKCLTNCGEPSQRWYHVPRSFLRKTDNTLVLFEELGGNPSDVSVQIATVGRILSPAYEGKAMKLSCEGGQRISQVNFANLRDGIFMPLDVGDCGSPEGLSMLKQACIGKESCSINVSDQALGLDGCNARKIRLAVAIDC